MNKIVKIILYVVGAIVLLAGAAVAYLHFSGIPKYEVKKFENYHVTVTPEKVERGRKLAMMLCVHCHQSRETNSLTGSRMLDAPKIFGTIHSQNITQDKIYGIGDWTDGELLYLLRTGIKRDGQYAPPYMAKLPHMADEDVDAIIAFLRSDDPMVAPASVQDTACQPSLFTKFLTRVAFKPLPMREKISPPDTTNMIELGKYYVYNLECYACHSASFETMDALEPPKSKGYLGGGNKTLNMQGEVLPTSNITPDKETGIGNWTEEQFVAAVRWGKVEGEVGLRYPMVPYTQLTDHEAKAIFAYLKTVPPIKNKVERPKL